MISELFIAYCAPIRDFFLLQYELFCLFDMAVAAEHAFNAPFLAWLILVAPKLFTAYCAMNDLLFAKDVQAKLLHASTHTKTYILLFYVKM
jgi:hypothetical protein